MNLLPSFLLAGRPMAALTSVGLLLGSLLLPAPTRADNFGSFDIEFVTVGNPGNPDDTGTTGVYHAQRGGVSYTYRIGKFEISRAMIESASGLGITLDDMSGLESGDTPQSPATGVSWNEAARFVNWLNETAGYPHAYKFAIQPGEMDYDPQANIELWDPEDDGYDADNPYRNKNAFYFLPSEDEWYKAAYYSGSGSTYYDFATGSDDIPDGLDFEGDTVFDCWVAQGENPLGPTEVNTVTAHTKASPYGTYHQCGNVREWTESDYTPPNDNGAENKAVQNAAWSGSVANQSSSRRNANSTTLEFQDLGFRVASADPNPPDPNAALKKSLSKKIKKLKKALKRAKRGKKSKAAKLKKKIKKLKQRLRKL